MGDLFQITPTTQQQQLATVGEMVERSENFARGAQGSLGQMFDLLWANRYGLTPQQAIAGFGTAGYSLFVRYTAAAAFFAQQRPDLSHKDPPAGFTITPQQDGSVVIADVAAPTAVVVTTDAAASNVPAGVTATFTDNQAVDVSTIVSGNVSAVGPAGTLASSGPPIVVGSGKSVIAIYSFDAPGGAWLPEHNGTYTVTVSGVADTSGNVMAPATGTFEVAV